MDHARSKPLTGSLLEISEDVVDARDVDFWMFGDDAMGALPTLLVLDEPIPLFGSEAVNL